MEMTMILTDRETMHVSGTYNGLMGKVKGFLSRSRAERQLHQLDDRLLADIGVVRGDISARVWGH
jgi:uncharacterized protein YjiS (DUF1127 family)